jgi:hypothetical protein
MKDKITVSREYIQGLLDYAMILSNVEAKTKLGRDVINLTIGYLEGAKELLK